MHHTWCLILTQLIDHLFHSLAPLSTFQTRAVSRQGPLDGRNLVEVFALGTVAHQVAGLLVHLLERHEVVLLLHIRLLVDIWRHLFARISFSSLLITHMLLKHFCGDQVCKTVEIQSALRVFASEGFAHGSVNHLVGINGQILLVFMHRVVNQLVVFLDTLLLSLLF